MSHLHTRLIQRPEVERRTGLARTTIYELIKAGRFPRPTKVGRASLWVEGEVEAWILERVAERDEADASW